MNWKDTLKQGQNIVLATSSKDGRPRAIIVVSLGFVDDRLLIGACMMGKSLENIKENNKVSIATFENNAYNEQDAQYIGRRTARYYRIDGVAEIYPAGKYLEAAVEKSSPPLPKAAIVIDIKEIFDLDKGEKIPI